MPPRKRKAAAPAGVDEADAPAVDLAPAAAVNDEQPARHASQGGATAGPGDAPAPAVETDEAGTGGDAACVAVSGEEAQVDTLQGQDAQPHAQPGGDDGGGVHSAEAPHAAPVASSVRASPAYALTQPCWPALDSSHRLNPRAHTSSCCSHTDASAGVCPPAWLCTGASGVGAGAAGAARVHPQPRVPLVAAA